MAEFETIIRIVGKYTKTIFIPHKFAKDLNKEDVVLVSIVKKEAKQDGLLSGETKSI